MMTDLRTTTEFHVAGDIRGTTAEALGLALAGLWQFRQKSHEELRLSGERLSFEIYSEDHGPGGWNYLVSGNIEGTLAEARAVVNTLANRLRAHHIVYSFELNDEANQGTREIVRHPDF